MTRYFAAIAVAAVMALLGGTYWLPTMRHGDDQFASCRASNVAGGAGSIGGPFTLVNSAGATVTDTDVITAPTLVYFGYTFCPDVCPLDILGNGAQGVFISIDPERDTPELVGEYAGYMHENMIGLTGSAEQVRDASQAYRTYYRKVDAEDEFYLVDHSTMTYLVLPEHGFVEFFRRGDSAEKVAETAACFMNKA